MTITEQAQHASIELLQRQSHQANKRWWHDPKTNEPIDPQTPHLFGEKLMLIVSEVAEALEGHRKDAMDAHLPHRKSVEVELADALIRIFDTAGAYSMDLAGAFIEKMAYNAIRADHTHAARNAPGGKAY